MEPPFRWRARTPRHPAGTIFVTRPSTTVVTFSLIISGVQPALPIRTLVFVLGLRFTSAESSAFWSSFANSTAVTGRASIFTFAASAVLALISPALLPEIRTGMGRLAVLLKKTLPSNFGSIVTTRSSARKTSCELKSWRTDSKALYRARNFEIAITRVIWPRSCVEGNSGDAMRSLNARWGSFVMRQIDKVGDVLSG